MKVELERHTDRGGVRSVRLVGNDIAQQPATLHEWIRMLEIAARWLEESRPKDDKP